MYSLRPYQQEAVDAVYKHLRERDTNPCVVIPTYTEETTRYSASFRREPDERSEEPAGRASGCAGG